MRTTRIAVALIAFFCLATSAAACLWDSDTLQMERLRFPGVLEIITGKFVRHSRAYYEWRIKDRLKKLEATPDDPALIDDLAVAYDKLGRYDEGIAILEKSLAADQGRYETLANLATLLFHAGRLEESKQHVQRALEINPNAHFGRKKYQLLLTEYVLQSELKTAGVMNTNYGDRELNGFAAFVVRAKVGDKVLRNETEAATRGVLGMMHFADHESPILLEALGDLLMVGPQDENNTQLAARAYLRAAEVSQNPAASKSYRQFARNSLRDHRRFDHLTDEEVLAKLGRELGDELAEGKLWFARIEANELKWIAGKKDVDREFATTYYDSLDTTLAAAENQVQREYVFSWIGLVGLACVAPLAVLVAGFVFVVRRTRRHPPASKLA